jgi:hypothetical protein
MREILRITVVLAVALVAGLAALDVDAQRRKSQTIIEGCTAKDLDTPGAKKCLNESVLSGSDMYVICEADGSKKCCVGTGSDRACYDIVGRTGPSPAQGTRPPTTQGTQAPPADGNRPRPAEGTRAPPAQRKVP